MQTFETPQQVCAAVPAHLDTHGWCQGKDRNGEGAECFRGAVADLANGNPNKQTGRLYTNAMALFERAVDMDPVTWNDANGRTLDEVKTASNKAAQRPDGGKQWACTTQSEIDAQPADTLIIIDDSWRESSHAVLWGSSHAVLWGSSVGIFRRYSNGLWLPTVAVAGEGLAASGEPLRNTFSGVLEVVPVKDRRAKPIKP